MARKKFLRSDVNRYKRFSRKNKQKWRKPRGRDNKIREKRAGRSVKVEMGFKGKKENRFKVGGKIPKLIINLKGAEKTKKEDLIIIGKIGKKKRQEIEKVIKSKGGKILNLKKKQKKKTVKSKSIEGEKKNESKK
jgi:large subunit ribosomal protein L32e